MRPGSFGHSVQTMISPPNQWRLVKSVLFFGIACGILGATIGSAFQALTGARLAAMIGGVPLAIIGLLALGGTGDLRTSSWKQVGGRSTGNPNPWHQRPR